MRRVASYEEATLFLQVRADGFHLAALPATSLTGGARCEHHCGENAFRDNTGMMSGRWSFCSHQRGFNHVIFVYKSAKRPNF